jgi:quinol monooxygenase YgiN
MDPEVIVVTAVFVPLEGRRDELILELQRAIPLVHGEEGCILYAIHDSADGTIVMIEKWASEELLSAHAEGEPVARMRAAIDGLLAVPVTVTKLRPIAAGTPEQGLL